MKRSSLSPPAASPRLRIHLFGRLRLEGETGPIPLPAKVGSLLAYLILHPELHARERLAALFWGDVPDDQAHHSLRTALSHLRKELGDDLLIGDPPSRRRRHDPG